MPAAHSEADAEVSEHRLRPLRGDRASDLDGGPAGSAFCTSPSSSWPLVDRSVLIPAAACWRRSPRATRSSKPPRCAHGLRAAQTSGKVCPADAFAVRGDGDTTFGDRHPQDAVYAVIHRIARQRVGSRWTPASRSPDTSARTRSSSRRCRYDDALRDPAVAFGPRANGARRDPGHREAPLFTSHRFSGGWPMRTHSCPSAQRWTGDTVEPLIRAAYGPLERALSQRDDGESWPRTTRGHRATLSPASIRCTPRSFFHRTECFGPVLGVIVATSARDRAAERCRSGLTGASSPRPREVERGSHASRWATRRSPWLTRAMVRRPLRWWKGRR